VLELAQDATVVLTGALVDDLPGARPRTASELIRARQTRYAQDRPTDQGRPGRTGAWPAQRSGGGRLGHAGLREI